MRFLLPAAALLLASPIAAQDAAPADSSRVYELAEVESPPQPVNVADLRAALHAGFPPERLAAGAGATVNVSFVVAADGTVREARVVSSTDAAFDAPSLVALAVLRFTPGTVSGTPVATRAEIPIQWRAPAPAAQASHAGEGVVSPTGRTEDGERVYAMSDVVASAYEASAVEEQPRPRNIGELRRAMERLYPPEARAARYRAQVTLRFRVDERGLPEHFTVVGSSDPAYDAISIEAASRLRFTPARLNGRPVKVWVQLPLHWEP